MPINVPGLTMRDVRDVDSLLGRNKFLYLADTEFEGLKHVFRRIRDKEEHWIAFQAKPITAKMGFRFSGSNGNMEIRTINFYSPDEINPFAYSGIDSIIDELRRQYYAKLNPR